MYVFIKYTYNTMTGHPLLRQKYFFLLDIAEFYCYTTPIRPKSIIAGIKFYYYFRDFGVRLDHPIHPDPIV